LGTTQSHGVEIVKGLVSSGEGTEGGNSDLTAYGVYGAGTADRLKKKGTNRDAFASVLKREGAIDRPEMIGYSAKEEKG